ncbi:AAA family ATPase [Pseudovibrio sp. Tun.PSC04-5.I4]|uniref:AAA family ATPase n=1 Tax=Pseudovibrio sp. Tun.PSC04-5.I4 TaxID=1798213 RepID=UPI00088FE44D|nr:AAA family ATPase [Pseudovibrio sp. Tun.PSC04-5.I4]SDQ29126.1 chromosome partitioning protein [Pseudovibrio sp. Tun.PSC04-5.I4]
MTELIESEVMLLPEGSLESTVYSDLTNLQRVTQITAEHARAPHKEKLLRHFTPKEAIQYLGMASTSQLAQFADKIGLELVRDASGRYRQYTLSDLNAVRQFLSAKHGETTTRALKFNPRRRTGDELSIIACANFKGGSAKTTTSVHLAHYLALKGYRVLVLDLDQQSSACSMFGVDPVLEPEDNLLGSALRYEDPCPIEQVIRPTYFEGIDLAFGGQWISEWEQDTPRVITEAKYHADYARQQLELIEEELDEDSIPAARLAELEDFRSQHLITLEDATEKKLYFQRLRKVLGPIEHNYDVVICDTSPTINFLSQATIGAADHLLITVHPEWLDIKSMEQYLTALFRHLSDLRLAAESVGLNAAYVGRTLNYLITRHDPYDVTEKNIADMMRAYLSGVLDNVMVKSSAISEAGLSEQSIYEADRKDFTAKTYDRAKSAMDDVNSEIEQIMLKRWGRV